MFFSSIRQKPKELVDIQELIIDRNPSHSDQLPTVCLDLDNTLLYVVNKRSHMRKGGPANIKPEWLGRCIDVAIDDRDPTMQFSILARPGSIELLVQLHRYANPVIYSSVTEEFIESLLLTLSIAQGDPDAEDYSDKRAEGAGVCMDLYSWSRKQCIQTQKGYKKSLGHFCEHNDLGINNVWMITAKPELVDITNRTVAVPPYYGDPDDRALFKLMDDIFIN
ncbi:hypothetical protein KDX31_15950 [Amphritea atlantica]|uniref:FCP1 homology domain-containing protein n=1 Tax=Amphritea atlantica TaxID=355243 RepID=A0ABY5GS93_9GAMM|nr:hypothetical protein KDX31_15950 [Amphritea atlantica]